MSRKKPDLLTQQARLRRKHREKGQVLAIFRKPMRESLTSVLPITAIVLLLCFTVTPVSNNAMMAFLIGSLLLTTVVLEVPPIAAAFGFTPVGWAEYGIALALAVLVIPVVELVKFIQRRRAR